MTDKIIKKNKYNYKESNDNNKSLVSKNRKLILDTKKNTNKKTIKKINNCKKDNNNIKNNSIIVDKSILRNDSINFRNNVPREVMTKNKTKKKFNIIKKNKSKIDIDGKQCTKNEFYNKELNKTVSFNSNQRISNLNYNNNSFLHKTLPFNAENKFVKNRNLIKKIQLFKSFLNQKKNISINSELKE